MEKCSRANRYLFKRPRYPFQTSNIPFTQFATKFERNLLPEVFHIWSISYDLMVDTAQCNRYVTKAMTEEVAMEYCNTRRAIGKELVYEVWTYPTRDEAARHAHLLAATQKYSALTNSGGWIDNFTHRYFQTR